MISKQEFVTAMEQLEALNKKMENVDSAMRELNPDFCSFYVIDAIDIPISILEEVFNDIEESWLGYFVWEQNWLHDLKLGDITVNGVQIQINNWEDVYDFLIENYDD